MTSILTKVIKKVKRAIVHPRVSEAIITFYGGKLPNRGFVFDVNNPYVSRINAILLFYGRYERFEIDFIEMYLRHDLDVVEFGSGIGVISASIARAQRPRHKLVCVETNPRLIHTLESNLKRNAPGRETCVLNAALDYSGKSEITLQITSNNLGTRVGSSIPGESVQVKTTTLAEIIQRQGIGEFALVSDCEGAETGMIAEDGEVFAKCQQMIIELHASTHNGQEYSVAMMRAKIESYGFRLLDLYNTIHVFTR